MSLNYGTTLAYSCTKGGVEPVTDNYPYFGMDLEYREYAQQGILEFQKQWFTLKGQKSLPKLYECVSVEILGSLIARVILCPTTIEAKFLGELSHDDNFGSQNLQKLFDANIAEKILKTGAEYLLDNPSLLRPHTTVFWPQLYITNSYPDFLIHKYSQLNPQHREVRALFQLKKSLQEKGVKTVIIYGASVTGKKIANFLKDAEGLHIIAFCDRNEKLWGTTLAGIPIYSFEYIQSLEFDAYIIGSMGRGKEISRYIEEFGDKKTTPQIILPF
jgi:hypothetical protein